MFVCTTKRAYAENSMASLPDMQRMGYSMVPIAIGVCVYVCARALELVHAMGFVCVCDGCRKKNDHGEE